MAGNRLTPEEAYRFARGEEVVSSTGVPAKLSRPLDFLVISDHAEGLGLMFQVYEGNPAFMQDPILAGWNKAMKEGGKAAADAANDVVSRQAQGTLPAPVKDPKIVGPVMKSVWQQYTATAEKYNDPGRFTAMIGYEWTSVPGGNNLHRNVLFRDGKDKADQVFPFSAWQSEDPEKLWAWMDQYETKTGGRLLAIPHNGNLSNGRMFELTDFSGQPLTRDYAERRARWEVLQEIVQTKGNSETHPTLVAERRVRRGPGRRRLGIRQPDARGQARVARDAPDHVPARRSAARTRAGSQARREPVQVRPRGRHRRAQLTDRDRGRQLLRQARQPGAEPASLGPCLEAGIRQDALHLALPRSRLRRRLGDGKHPRGDLGRDEAQGGLRHLGNTPDRALLRRL